MRITSGRNVAGEPGPDPVDRTRARHVAEFGSLLEDDVEELLQVRRQDRVVGEPARLEAGSGEERVLAVGEDLRGDEVLARDVLDPLGYPLERLRHERDEDPALHGVLDLLAEIVPELGDHRASSRMYDFVDWSRSSPILPTTFSRPASR